MLFHEPSSAMDHSLYEPLVQRVNLSPTADGSRLEITWPANANIAADTLACHARGERADHVALIYEALDGAISRFTFAELDDRAARLAAALAARGVRHGDRVAVHTGQTPATAIAHAAIHKLGAVVLTLSQLYGPDTVEHVLRDCGAAVVITDRDTWDRLIDAHGPFDGVRSLIVCHGEARGDESSFDDCIAGHEPVTAVATRADDPALLMYTSGSTGMPKGMLHAHRILHAYLPTITAVYDLELDRDGAVFWSPSDWAWVGGLLDLVLPAWLQGQTVVATQQRFSTEWAFEFMARHGVTHSFMTPTALKRLAEVPDPRSRYDLAIRVICTGGESLPGDVVRWAEEKLGIVCNEFYGLTEFNHLVGNCKALFPIVPGSMGRAFPGRTVAVIDDQGTPQPDGVVGEMASWEEHDPSLFLGYWGDPGVPERMRLQGWLRTGDLAKRDADGYYWYQGRNDDLIKSAGYRIGPAEVEDALVRHPRVAEAAVIAKPDAARGSIVKAFVRLMPGETGDADLVSELQTFVKTNLAAYKYPREIEFVESFPLTSSGKIRRAELRQREQGAGSSP